MNRNLLKVGFVLLLLQVVTVQAQIITVQVNTAQNKRKISPNIYGRNNSFDKPMQFYKDAGLRFARMNGGNNASGYNWTNRLSVSPDWYNNVYINDWDASAKIVNDNFSNMQGMFAFQLLGRVASSGQYNFDDWGFNQAQYWSGTGQNLNGNGIPNTAGGSKALVDGDITLFSKPWPADSSVGILNHWFGVNGLGYDKNKFVYWSMDNEVDVWNGTHDWAMPTLIAASAFMDRYIALAYKAKAMYPGIKLCGPVTTSEWQYYKWSSESIYINGRYYSWIEYFIKRLADEYKATGVKLVDVVDIHNYPWYNNDVEALQGHRFYYDTTYAYPGANGIKTMNGGWDNSLNKEYFFIRVENWLNEHFGANHGITTGVSEWGTMTKVGNPSLESVIYSSHLGTFANHGVELFSPWNWSIGMWESLHLYSRYAKDYSVSSTSSMEDTTSAYTSISTAGDSLTVMLVNKSINNSKTVTVNLGNFTVSSGNYNTLQIASLPSTETFVSHTQNALVKGTVTVNSNSFTITVPKLSTTAILLSRPPISICSSLSIIGTIAGGSSLCAGATATYSVPGVSSATGYAWSVPVGSSIVSGVNSNIISLNVGSIGGSISVKAFNSCSTISSLNFPVIVNPTIAPSVAISSSSTTICSGNGVTFTATGLNGGTNPTYTWIKNYVSQTAGSTYSYLPANGDIVKVVMVTGGSASCLSGNSATSSGLSINVNAVPSITPYLQINNGTWNQISTATVCSGSTVAFGPWPNTAQGWTWTGPNGYTSTQRDPSIANALTSLTGTYIATYTDGNGCKSSYPFTITINQNQTTSVSIASSVTTVCSGTGITFTASGINGGSNPTYTWLKNNLSQGTGTAFSYSPANGDVVKAILTAGGTLPNCLIGNPATSNGINLTVNPVPTSSVTISSSATTVCSGTGVTFTATGVNGGTAPTYAWLKNNVQVSTGQTYSYIPTNGDVITAKLTAGGTLPTCLSTSTAVSSAINLTVNPVPTSSVTISSSATTVCSGTGVTFTATGVNGGTAPTYAWLKNNVQVSTGQTYSYIPANGDAVTAKLTAGGTLPTCLSTSTAASTAINLTVNPVPTSSVTISSSATTVCSGTGVTFTATGVNGGTAPTYSWLKNNVQVSTGQTYSYIPANGDAVTAKLTAGGTLPTCLSTSTAASTAINLTVNPVPTSSVTISSSATTVCSGTGVTFTATGVNGGTAPTFTWLKNNVQVSTGQTYSYIPTNGDVITAKLTAGGTLPTCPSTSTAVSSAINLTVNPTPTASVSVSPSSNPVCSGTGVTFTATPLNGGSSPTFNWLVNNIPQTGNANVFTYTPSNNDVVKAIVFTGGTGITCNTNSTATSSGVTTNVNGTIAASIAIAPTPGAICAGSTVSVTASATGTGSSPTFTWLVNNVAQSGNTASFAFNPSNNDQVKVIMAPGGNGTTCITGGTVTSTGITLTVNAIQMTSVSISSSLNTVCAGANVTFTATGVNTGTSPTYSWLVNNQAQGTGATFNYSAANGDVVKAKLTAGGTMPACLIGSPATSNGISLTVNPVQTLSVSIVPSATTVCSGTGVSLTATGVNGGTSPTYSWLVNNQAQGTGATFNYSPANGDVVKAKLTAGGTLPACLIGSPATSNGINLTVNPVQIPSVSIAPSATTVCSGAGITFTSTGVNTGTLPTYSWLVNNQAQGTGITFSYSPSNGDVVKAILVAGGTLPTCLANTTAASNPATIVANPCPLPQPGSISGPSFVATGTSSVVYSVPNTPGDSYVWTVPSGATITGGQGTNSLTVSYGSIIGSGTIGLQQTNSNGTTSVNLTVSTGVLPASTVISGPASVNPNQTGATYSVASVPGISYTWSVPAGAVIVSGQGTSSIVVDFPASVSGFVGLGQTNNFGSVFDSLGVDTSVPTSYASSIESLNEITLFPNPSSGTFQIKLGNNGNSAIVTVMDDNGLVQLVTDGLVGLGGSLRSGHYIVTVQTQNGVKHLPFAKLE